MKYSAKTGTLSQQKAEVAILSLQSASKLAKAFGQEEVFTAATADFKNAVGKLAIVHFTGTVRIPRAMVIGGLDQEVSARQFRQACAAAAASLKSLPVRSALWNLSSTKVEGTDLHWRATAGMYALSQALYSYDSYKSKDNKASPQLRSLYLLTDKRGEKVTQRAVREGNALRAGLDFARDLGNEPPNVCNPSYLLKQARALARADKVKVSALDEKRMTELGMGAFMSVSQGSDTPGKMIIIQYSGGKRGEAPVALVGKGITFDTGGISIKPAPAMDEMKFDMCGAASVLGTTKAVIDAKLPINLVTIVAAAENMPSGRASRPGDIVTSMSGQSVEILNTDAEGRLVLCDALTYVKKFKPSAVVDVATLTGAVIVALGSHASGLYANDEDFAEELLSAGERSGDRAWQLPLWEDYQKQLSSNFADMANVGGREAGSVTAACFLARFTKDLTWAHLDIAGSAFKGGASKGATGRPVHLLFSFIKDRANG
ncbi:MAG: leucyl aminopeptidase [Pseudomonadales bacterium]